MMKFICTCSIIFSFFFCYSQDTDNDSNENDIYSQGYNKAKKGEPKFKNDFIDKSRWESRWEFRYIMGSSLISEKQDGKLYKLQSSLGGVEVRRYFHMISSIDNSFSIFLTTGLSLKNFVSNYSSDKKHYLLKKKYIEVPLLFTVKHNNEIYGSVGFYGSWMFWSTKKTDGEPEEVNKFKSAFNFGFMAETAFWYQVTDSLYFSVGIPLKLEFATIYDSVNKVEIEPIWAVNIGFSYNDIIADIYHIFF